MSGKILFISSLAIGQDFISKKSCDFCLKYLKGLKGLKLEIDVSSFNQINDEIAEKLYDFIIQNAITTQYLAAKDIGLEHLRKKTDRQKLILQKM